MWQPYTSHPNSSLCYLPSTLISPNTISPNTKLSNTHTAYNCWFYSMDITKVCYISMDITNQSISYIFCSAETDEPGFCAALISTIMFWHIISRLHPLFMSLMLKKRLSVIGNQIHVNLPTCVYSILKCARSLLIVLALYQLCWIFINCALYQLCWLSINYINCADSLSNVLALYPLCWLSIFTYSISTLLNWISWIVQWASFVLLLCY